MRSRSISSAGPSAARINTRRRWAGSTRSPFHATAWSRRCPCRQRRDRRCRIISSWYRRAGHATPPTCSGRSVPHGHDGEVTRRLHRIKELAAAMAVALLAGDLPEFGALLHDSWQLKRGLVQGVSSTEIDRWYQIARDRAPTVARSPERAAGDSSSCPGSPRGRDPQSPRGRSRSVAVRLRRPGVHRKRRSWPLARDPEPISVKGPAHETANIR